MQATWLLLTATTLSLEQARMQLLTLWSLRCEVAIYASWHCTATREFNFWGPHFFRPLKPMALVPHEDGDEEVEEQEAAWPPKHELAALWDSHDVIRAQMRTSGKLLVWPTPASTGIPSKVSLKLNRWVVLLIIKVWGKHHASPKSPPIGWLRQEARQLKNVSMTHRACMPMLYFKSLPGEGDPPLAHGQT